MPAVSVQADELQHYLKGMPSASSSDWGAPFYKTFKAAGFDFFKVDHNVFAPAKVVMNEIKSRRTFVSGKVSFKVLAESFGLEMVDAGQRA